MQPIKRVRPSNEGTPPWAGISFIHPIDSDELHDLLKRQYPQYTTVRERKHKAAIDFLLAELREMQNKTAYAMPEQSRAAELFAYPAPSNLGYRNQGDHIRSFNDTATLSHINSSRSPMNPGEDRLRYQSPAAATTSNVGGGQQFVFKAVDGQPVRRKNRTKMTTEEKIAYAKTRKAGACERCKRKREKVCINIV